MDRETELAFEIAGRLAAEVTRKLLSDYRVTPATAPGEISRAIQNANDAALGEFRRLAPLIEQALRLH